MMEFEIGQQLPVCEMVTHNYATDAANKIHSNDGAVDYGFEGGLVPGVAIYAYLTRPIVGALGPEWLEHGRISAKFLKPVYDKERIRVQATISDVNPIAFNLELINPSGTLCAIGSAGLPFSVSTLDAENYPQRTLGQPRPATIAAIPAGEIFGTLAFDLDLNGDVRELVVNVVDASSIYRGENAQCHPAYWIAQANEVIMQNVALGMWIHTSSETQHHRAARNGEAITMRSRVIEAYEKRGHELITLDIGVFGENDRPIARINHTAIIKLKDS